jgi:hypothetical protein
MSIPMSNFRGKRFWKLAGAAIVTPLPFAEWGFSLGYHDQATAYVLVSSILFCLAIGVNRFAASRAER